MTLIGLIWLPAKLIESYEKMLLGGAKVDHFSCFHSSCQLGLLISDPFLFIHYLHFLCTFPLISITINKHIEFKRKCFDTSDFRLTDGTVWYPWNVVHCCYFFSHDPGFIFAYLQSLLQFLMSLFALYLCHRDLTY